MDRRTFVKTCVGVASAGALAASGVSMAAGLAIPRKPAGALVQYWGTNRVDGPAPRGMPYIPITVDDAGNFVGKPSITMMDGSTASVLDWYKYCGHSGAPGLKEDYRGDETLKYLQKDDYNIVTPWFKDLLNQPVRPEHFLAPGFGAAFRWRSEGQSGVNIISGSIIRAAPIPGKNGARVEVASPKPPGKILEGGEDELEWLKREIFHTDEATGDVYIGVSTYCTHFCCTPAFREAESLARRFNAWDNIYCTCHNSNYNFRQPARFTMAPEVATEEGGFDPLLTRGGGAAGGE